jgi:hypothetical protein
MLRKTLKKSSRSVEMKKLTDLKNVGIFFDASSEKCLKEVKAFIKELNGQNINTKAIGFFNAKEAEDNLISDRKMFFATLKDFSFFFLPKSEELKEFTQNEMDALLVYSADDCFPATATIKLSKAKLKVGLSGKFDDALDLTFELANNAPEQLTEQIKRYL